MLGWRIAAQVLVIAGGVLALTPFVEHIQVWLEKGDRRTYLQSVCAATIMIGLFWVISPAVEGTRGLPWFAEYAWWKLVLGALALLLSLIGLALPGLRRKRWGERIPLVLPYALVFPATLVAEVLSYRGQMFYLALLYAALVLVMRLSFLLAKVVALVLRDKLSLLVLAVACISLATAIQLFILP